MKNKKVLKHQQEIIKGGNALLFAVKCIKDGALYLGELVLKRYIKKTQGTNEEKIDFNNISDEQIATLMEKMDILKLEKLNKKLEKSNNKKQDLMNSIVENDDEREALNEGLKIIFNLDDYILLLKQKIENNISKQRIPEYMRSLLYQFGNFCELMGELKKANFKKDKILTIVYEYQTIISLFLEGNIREAQRRFVFLARMINNSKQINLGLALTQVLDSDYKEAFKTVSRIKIKDVNIKRAINALDKASNSLAIGSLIGSNYKIISFIAEGGMGDVYLVENIENKELAALKVLKEEFSNDSSFVRSFEKEIALLKSLESEFFARYYEDGRVNGQIFFIMEYVKGVTLLDYLGINGPLDNKNFYYLAMALLDGLEDIHKKSILHRDISPINIIVLDSKDNKSNKFLSAKYIDLGISSLASKPIATVTRERGNDFFSPIEQRIDGKTYPASDYYSLILSLLYSKTFPYIPKRHDRDNYSSNLNDFFKIGLHENYEERFKSINEIKNKFNDFAFLEIYKDVDPKISGLYQKVLNRDLSSLKELVNIFYNGTNKVKKDIDAVYTIIKQNYDFSLNDPYLLFHFGQVFRVGGKKFDINISEAFKYLYQATTCELEDKKLKRKIYFEFANFCEKLLNIAQNEFIVNDKKIIIDYKFIIKYYKLAAKLREGQAALRMAQFYEKGKEVSFSYSRAEIYYMIAKAGNIDVKDDLKRIRVVMNKLFPKDNIMKMTWLAFLLYFFFILYCICFLKSFVATKYFLGVLLSFFLLIVFLNNHIFTKVYPYVKKLFFGDKENEPNYNEAFKYLVHLHRLKLPITANLLSYSYYNGLGVEKNNKKAFEVLDEIGNRYHEFVSYNLGYYYLYGHGVEQNIELAIKHFNYANKEIAKKLKNEKYTKKNNKYYVSGEEIKLICNDKDEVVTYIDILYFFIKKIIFKNYKTFFKDCKIFFKIILYLFSFIFLMQMVIKIFS